MFSRKCHKYKLYRLCASDKKPPGQCNGRSSQCKIMTVHFLPYSFCKNIGLFTILTILKAYKLGCVIKSDLCAAIIRKK